MSASFRYIIIEIYNKLLFPLSNKEKIERTFLIVDTSTGKITESIFNNLDEAFLSCRNLNILESNKKDKFTRIVYLRDEYEVKICNMINETTKISLDAYFLRCDLKSKTAFERAISYRKGNY
ncbi:MAG: hypothetical protein QM578_23330 [Pantoea sp.]|uniref:hypothetical protein n=1 Tax=Pantoea sp. TaxID=69393 RepID=UPI0039E64B27